MITENGETFFLLGDKKLPSLQIELVTADGKLARHQFPRLELVTCLTDAHKNQIMCTIDISSESVKLQDLMRHAERIYEGVHRQQRAEAAISKYVSRGAAHRHLTRDYERLGWLLAVALNAVLLATAPSCVSSVALATRALGALALACYALRVAQARALTGETAGLANLACAALNLSVSHFWGACLLLNIVRLSPRLQNIAKACFLPIIDLVMVGVVLLCVVYVFAVLVFVAFAADLGDRAADCASLWGCFKMTLSGGVRNFGGVSDVLTPSNGGARVAFDLLCFAVVGLVMSLFGGIIRDTFASLREETAQRIDRLCSKAFISGLDRTQIGDELWTRIAERDQPVWNYVLFVWYLWENEKHRWHHDDELEAFVLECVKARDPKWLPMGRALCLPNDSRPAPSLEEQVALLQKTVEALVKQQSK